MMPLRPDPLLRVVGDKPLQVLACPGKAAWAARHGSRNSSCPVRRNPRWPVSRSMTSRSSPLATTSTSSDCLARRSDTRSSLDRGEQDREGGADDQREQAAREEHATGQPTPHQASGVIEPRGAGRTTGASVRRSPAARDACRVANR